MGDDKSVLGSPTIIRGTSKEIDGLPIARLLPSRARRSIGPFVFFDLVAPAQLAAGQGINVRPHPHIGLATLTWLFEGAIWHRDSTGADQVIAPGAVNWMVAGHGVVHSERPVPDSEHTAMTVHAAQFWVALPKSHEEVAPFFEHHPPASLPVIDGGHWTATLVAGTLWGKASPASVFSRLALAEIRAGRGAELPAIEDFDEVGLFVVRGQVRVGDVSVTEGDLAFFAAEAGSRCCAIHCESDDTIGLVLAGDRLDGPRFLDWNFVASDSELLKAARERWRRREFPTVPGDETDFIPLPGG